MRNTLGGPREAEIRSAQLYDLLIELYSATEIGCIDHMVVGGKLNLDAFSEFDFSLGGPSALTIADPTLAGGTLNMPGQGVGRYDAADREVFRPLQYCSVYMMVVREDAEWLARTVVRDASAHIEALLQRIAQKRFSLGVLLRKQPVIEALDSQTVDQARRFADINNAAKHDYDHPKDTHMFSYPDAINAYFIARRLGLAIYSVARLATDVAVFDVAPAGFNPRTGHLTSAST